MADDNFDFLKSAYEKGQLRPDQAEAFERIKKRRAYKRLKSMARQGKLRPDQVETFNRIDPSSFEGQTTPGTAVTRGAVDEASLGFADEIGGFLRGGFTDAEIPTETARIRADSRIAQEDRPSSYLGGQIGGGVASALVPGSAALRLARAGAGLGKRIGASAAAGAATEGVRGFGQGEGPGDPALREAIVRRLGHVPGNALIGGGIGAAAPVVGRGIENVTRRVGNALSGSKIAGVGRRTAEELLDLVLRDRAATGRGITAGVADPRRGSSGALSARLGRMGPDAVLADAGDDYALMAAEAARVGGVANPRLQRALAERAAGAPARIRGELDRSVAPAGTARNMSDRIDARKRAIGQQYDDALANSGPIDASGLISSIQRDAEVAGPTVKPVLSRYLKALEAHGGVVPAKAMHNIRSDFASEIDRLQSQGQNKQAALLTGLLPRFDAALDEVPGYRAAREAYSIEMGLAEALREGESAFKGASRVPPSELAAQMAARSPDARRHFRYGMREGLDRVAGTRAKGEISVADLLDQRYNRGVIDSALRSPEAKRLMNRLETERRFADTAKTVGSAVRSGSRRGFAEGLEEGNKGLSMPGQMGIGLINRLVDASKLSPRRRTLNDVAGRYDSRADFRLGRIPEGLAAGVESRMRRGGMANQLIDVFSRQGKARNDVVQGLLRQLSSRERRALEAFLAGQFTEQGIRSLAPVVNVR